MNAWRCGVALVLAIVLASPSASGASPSSVTFTVDTLKPLRTFVPNKVFGIAVDGGDQGESTPLLSTQNRGPMEALGAALGTYRLRTELAIQAWHWSAHGGWSEPQRNEGYWTGDPEQDDASPVSYGYRLPRRGDTHDEADDNGYSRILDGDLSTFWKSNPYLDEHYTGASSERAEWIKIDLGKTVGVDTLEIDWADPFALRYAVDYWDERGETGRWVAFPSGQIADGRGGVERRRLSDRLLETRYVRLRLQASSHTAAAGGHDPRDAMGFAVRELRLGRSGPDGRLIDVLRHGPGVYLQSEAVVSSTDPWHRAVDIDVSTEQPSPLSIVQSGIVGASFMLPVGVLYDTPENALAEVRYFTRRRLPMFALELGEEPDGQRVAPEDYAALYVQFAKALHGVLPDLPLGGPSLVNGFATRWMEEGPAQSWTQGFLQALSALHASDQLKFYSVEHYPNDDLCGPAGPKLADEPRLMDSLFKRFTADGLPADTPRIISEYGLSAFSGRLEVEPPSAVFTALVGTEFLKRGGATAFIYGANPGTTARGEKPCAGDGGMMLWETDKQGRAHWPMPSYFGWRLLTHDWMEPGGGVHTLFEAKPLPPGSPPTLTVDPLRRPDGRWSVLVLNAGERGRRVGIDFEGGGPRAGGAAQLTQYGASNYKWSARDKRPVLDRPPTRHSSVWGEPICAPPFSITVVTDGPLSVGGDKAPRT